MEAMVFTRPGLVEMLDVPEPVVGEGEIVLDVALAGICGSELHGIGKPGFRTPPLVMGHEFAGTAPDGRRVTVNPIGFCGRCDLCRAGRGNVCRERNIVGIHRPGAFAERVVVPAQQIHELPDDVTWATAAMVEPLANGVHAWNVAGAPAGARVGVIGAGTIGLVCLQAALAGGAGEVTVVDLTPSRLPLAERLGASSVAASLTGEFDVVIDAVGIGATHQASLEHLAPGGTAVWIGLMGSEAGFDSLDLVRMEKSVRGTFAYTDPEFAAAVELARTTDLSWADVFPLSGGADIFMDLMEGRNTEVVKALLQPQGAV